MLQCLGNLAEGGHAPVSVNLWPELTGTRRVSRELGRHSKP